MNALTSSLSWATFLLFPVLTFSTVTQAPDIRNTEIETVVVAGNLRALVEETAHASAEPTWMAWTVPMVEGERLLCCWGRSGRGRQQEACPLETSRRQFVFTNDLAAFRPTDQAALAMVLLRTEDGKLDDIQVYSVLCPLDAGGRQLSWFDRVDPAASVRVLSELATGTSALTDEDLADEALMALALHETAAADIVIEELASSAHAADLREEAIFWLGEARGEKGFEALERILDQEKNGEVRSHVAFALTLSSATGAEQRLIEMARSDRDAETRGEALFWLAQQGGPRVVDTLLEALERDPSDEVRDEAIFALSQLPDGGGTLPLLKIARDGRQQPSVRQEAIFWLAQSDDDRALDLITEILRR